MSSMGFAPRFCPTHLKIHVCELMNPSLKLKNAEDELGAKVRRLHGKQTQEELDKQAAKAKPQAGTIGDILAKAKQKIAHDKEELEKMQQNSGEFGHETSENEIGDRMAALRAKMAGKPVDSPTAFDSDPRVQAPITSGIGAVIQKARKHQSENPEQEMKIRERSHFGEKGNIAAKDLNLSQTAVSTMKSSVEGDDFFEIDQEVKLNAKNVDKKLKSVKAKKQSFNDEKMFSLEETQDLIQSAVAEALKQMGIDPTKTAKKAVKKSPTKKTSVKPKETTKKAPAKKVETKTKSTKTKTSADPSKRPNLK